MTEAEHLTVIIPARGGSKRIPDKNIRPFCGKPMLAHAIENAQSLPGPVRIIVSTEDERIARIAETYGAEVPFQRPAELADDHTGTSPVINHAIEWLTRHEQCGDLVCCLYPATPLLGSKALRKGLDVLRHSPDLNFSFAAARYRHPIQRAFREVRFPSGGWWPQRLDPASGPVRTQDLPPSYHDVGAFYFGRRAAWLGQLDLFSERTRVVLLPPLRAVDIDEEDDWAQAEFQYRYLQSLEPESGPMQSGRSS